MPGKQNTDRPDNNDISSTREQKLYKSINFKLLKFILLVSATFTLLSTGVQLYVEYQEDLKFQSKRILAIEESHLPALSMSIWTLEPNLIHLQLESILSLPDIQSVELKTNYGESYKTGTEVEDDKRKTHKIELYRSGSKYHLGTLWLNSDLNIHLNRTKDRFFLILITHAFQTFFVSLIIFFLVEIIVTRHLGKISNYLKNLRIDKLDEPLFLDREKPNSQDDLDTVVDSVNELRSTLESEIRQLEVVHSNLGKSESMYRTLYDTMVQGVVYQNSDGKIISANKAAEEILGLSLDQMQGRTSIDPRWRAIHENGEDYPGETHPAMEVLRTGKEITNALMGVYNPEKGSYSWILVSSKLETRQGDQKPDQVFSTFTDISQRKQAEEELRVFHRAVEASSVMVIITDVNGIIHFTNPKFTEITGYTSEEAIGQKTSILKSGEHTDAFYVSFWETILSHQDWKGEFHNRKKDGTLYWGHSSISCLMDITGNITHFIAIQEDVTQEHILTDQLNHHARHDMLTGLINRREFEQRVSRLLATLQDDRGEHAMCFLDLDQFKIINDSCGHTAGDELLRQVGKLLQDTVRKRDSLARLGGDEFGILMEHCPFGKANRVANNILKSINDFHFIWEGKAFRIGVSIGLVAITETAGNYTDLFKQADAACYLAKDLGRNRIHAYHPEDTELAIRHGEMQWVGRISQALEENLFCLYAQPIVSLGRSDQNHYELLIRMLDDQGGTIPPGAFLPAAERYNLMGKLDSWVVNHACSILAQHPAFIEWVDFISINLSGPSLNNQDFFESILANFKENGVPPRKICFEITETVAIDNLDSAVSLIRKLKASGFQFALDDFGSGISSFGYLKNLPVDYLKIDGMFVKGIVDDPIDRAMVKSINEIGQVMGMKTIAEFVENEEIRGTLREIGVDYAQGYGIGKPQPLTEILVKQEEDKI